jgi:hypothetical protein
MPNESVLVNPKAEAARVNNEQGILTRPNRPNSKPAGYAHSKKVIRFRRFSAPITYHFQPLRGCTAQRLLVPLGIKKMRTHFAGFKLSQMPLTPITRLCILWKLTTALKRDDR